MLGTLGFKCCGLRATGVEEGKRPFLVGGFGRRALRVCGGGGMALGHGEVGLWCWRLHMSFPHSNVTFKYLVDLADLAEYIHGFPLSIYKPNPMEVVWPLAATLYST